MAPIECGDPAIVSVDVEPDVADEQWLVSSPLKLTAEPKFGPSTVNCTAPVGGVIPDAGQTLAVKVTGWPKTEAFAEEESAVDVSTLGGALTA